MGSNSDSEWELASEPEYESEENVHGAQVEEEHASDSDDVARSGHGLRELLEGSNSARNVASIRAKCCCKHNCFGGREEQLQQLLESLERITQEERKASIYTSLSLCSLTSADSRNAPEHPRSRDRYTYYLPLVGKVCMAVFSSAYGVSHRTLVLYRKHVHSGSIAVAPHANSGKRNHAILDEEALVSWMRDFVKAVGDVVPVYVRLRKEKDGRIMHYYSYEDHMLLPSFFTWQRVLDEYKTYLEQVLVDQTAPSLSSTRRILRKRAPEINIRSPRDQVCDQCKIYNMKLTADTSASVAETFADHVMTAKAMRSTRPTPQKARRDKDYHVITVDFAQNLTLPHAPETPSGWYFLSLISVYLFGAHVTRDDSTYTYMYSERKGGKGANEVVSMIHATLELQNAFERPASIVEPNEQEHSEVCAPLSARERAENQKKRQSKVDAVLAGDQAATESASLNSASSVCSASETRSKASVVIWADNCGGQNNNSMLLWYLCFLIAKGAVREAALKFLVKGHTNNSCGRTFGNVKRGLARKEAWTMATLDAAIRESATSTTAVCLEDTDHPFRDIKGYFSSVFKRLDRIQFYQIFHFPENEPGTVVCRKTPESEPTAVTLFKRNKSLQSGAWNDIWNSIDKVPEPKKNPEKQSDIFSKIRPYVPKKYQSDSLYEKPSQAVELEAREIKRRRRETVEQRKRDADEGKIAAV